MNQAHWKQLLIKREENLTQKLKQPAIATEVVVTPYKTTMLADGKDAPLSISAWWTGRDVKCRMQIILIHFSCKAMQRSLALVMVIQAVMNRINVTNGCSNGVYSMANAR